MHKILLSLLLATVVLLDCTSNEAFADDLNNSKIDYLHTPPTIAELPDPGKPLTLTVTLKKDQVTMGIKVQAYIARDGKLMEVQDADPKFDTSDRLIYKIILPSPLAEISYQFIFTDKAGKGSSSTRYSVQRPCIPDVRLTSIQKTGDKNVTVTKDDVGKLISESKGLERDISLYEQIISQLGDIHTVVDKK